MNCTADPPCLTLYLADPALLILPRAAFADAAEMAALAARWDALSQQAQP